VWYQQNTPHKLLIFTLVKNIGSEREKKRKYMVDKGIILTGNKIDGCVGSATKNQRKNKRVTKYKERKGDRKGAVLPE